MKTEQKTKTCRVPDCTSETVARGLCKKHYALALHYVKRRKTSWSKLEKQGKVLPSRVGNSRGRRVGKAARWLLSK